MRTRKTLGGALAAILLLILTQLIAQGAAGLLAMIKLPAGVCNIIAGILYVGLAYAALRLLCEKVLHEQTASKRKIRAQNVHNAKQERRHDDGDDLVPTLCKEVQDHAAKDHFLYESGGDASERDPGAEGAEHLASAHIRAHKCAAKEQQIAAGHGQRQENRRDCPAGLNVQLRHPECCLLYTSDAADD